MTTVKYIRILLIERNKTLTAREGRGGKDETHRTERRENQRKEQKMNNKTAVSIYRRAGDWGCVTGQADPENRPEIEKKTWKKLKSAKIYCTKHGYEVTVND